MPKLDVLAPIMAHLLVLQETDDFEALIAIDGRTFDLDKHFNAASRIASVEATPFLIVNCLMSRMCVGEDKVVVTVHDVASILRNVCVAP